MADMAIECAGRGMEVYFITIEPAKPFFSSGGRETMISLLQPYGSVRLFTKKIGWQFEFGTEPFKARIYMELVTKNVPKHANIILSDDSAVWRTSELLNGQYNFIGVLHADEPHYYSLAKRYKDSLDFFVCVSQRITNTLKALDLGIDADRIDTIPCGIPLPDFKPLASNNQLLTIVYAGRITQYQKRVFDIPVICKLLREQSVPFQLSIIGSGHDQKYLEEQMVNAALEKHVNFLGWLSKEQIFECMRVSDLLILTSDFEGMPIAVMEALSCGCGVVSTRVSGVEDYEFHPLANNCVWLYDIGDVSGAVRKIAEAKEVLRDTRQAAARSLAEAEFDIGLCLKKYLKAFEGIKMTFKKPSRKKAFSLPRYIGSYLLSYTRYLRVNLALRK